MAGFTRAKRVTDPLDDRAKARLVGVDCRPLSYDSSGSEHSGDSSPCLSELVHDFLEESESETRSLDYDSESDLIELVADCKYGIQDILQKTVSDNVDSYEQLLRARVLKAMEEFSLLRSNKQVLQRNVMSYLRELGYNAAICKTKWETSGGITSGNYEFIDVVQSSSKFQNRYFVDLDFAAEFEIARPTIQYARSSHALPRVFVGNGDDLKKIVRAMSDMARRSLKIRELSVPPWRKNRYMQNKWFAPYRRTTNQIQAKSSSTVISTAGAVKWRCVGFDDAVSNINGRFFVPTR